MVSSHRTYVFLTHGIDMLSRNCKEFTNIWETEFNVLDPAFDCNVNRTKGDPATQMYLINHFLDTLFLGQPIPLISKLNQTNAASGPGSLGAHVDTCVADHGRPPNFMLVDVCHAHIHIANLLTSLSLVLRIWQRICV